MSGIILNPRDVIQIAIDFGSNHEIKLRPALIISNTYLIQNSDSVIVLPITRNQTTNPYMIKINASDMETGSLPFESQVICDNIFTREKLEIRKQYGRVTKFFFGQVINLVITKTFENISTNTTRS